MFRALGGLVYRRRWFVVGLWALVIGAGVMASGPLGQRVTAEFGGSERIESARALRRIEETSVTGGDIAIVIDGVSALEGVPAEVQHTLAKVSGVPGVVSVVDPWSSGMADLAATDGQAALIIVSYCSASGTGGPRHRCGAFTPASD